MKLNTFSTLKKIIVHCSDGYFNLYVLQSFDNYEYQTEGMSQWVNMYSFLNYEDGLMCLNKKVNQKSGDNMVENSYRLIDFKVSVSITGKLYSETQNINELHEVMKCLVNDEVYNEFIKPIITYPPEMELKSQMYKIEHVVDNCQYYKGYMLCINDNKMEKIYRFFDEEMSLLLVLNDFVYETATFFNESKITIENGKVFYSNVKSFYEKMEMDSYQTFSYKVCICCIGNEIIDSSEKKILLNKIPFSDLM